MSLIFTRARWVKWEFHKGWLVVLLVVDVTFEKGQSGIEKEWTERKINSTNGYQWSASSSDEKLSIFIAVRSLMRFISCRFCFDSVHTFDCSWQTSWHYDLFLFPLIIQFTRPASPAELSPTSCDETEKANNKAYYLIIKQLIILIAFKSTRLHAVNDRTKAT